jgi:histidinol-phosphate aminotransferase
VIQHGLERLDGVTVFTSEANFVLFHVEHAATVWRDLLHGHEVLVRDLSRVPYLEDCLRVSVGSPEENARFLKAMAEIVASRRKSGLFGTTNGESLNGNGETAEGEREEPRD